MTEDSNYYTVEYDNSGRVENSDELVSEYPIDAALFRAEAEDHADLDMIYGPEPRNLLDIFWPGDNRDCPIVVFIHGGYWQRLDKSSFSHMARGLNAHGIAVALPSYTLCPDITIEGIITEIRRACILLNQTYKKPLTVIGHSAGGHLAACMMATDWPNIHPSLPDDLVASGMGISGLYDLLPLLQTPINDALELDEANARRASPILWIPDALQQFDAWVGGEESSEFHRQAIDLEQRWKMLGTPARYVSLKGANHFTTINPLTDPQSEMVARILELIEKPAAEGLIPEPDEEKILAEMQQLGPESAKEPDSKQVAKSQPTAKDKPEPDADKRPSTPRPKVKVKAAPTKRNAAKKPAPSKGARKTTAKAAPSKQATVEKTTAKKAQQKKPVGEKSASAKPTLAKPAAKSTTRKKATPKKPSAKQPQKAAKSDQGKAGPAKNK